MINPYQGYQRRWFLMVVLVAIFGVALVACGTSQAPTPQPIEDETPPPSEDPMPEDPTPEDPAPEDPADPEEPPAEEPPGEDPDPDEPPADEAEGPQDGSMRVLYLYGSKPPALHDMKLSDTSRVGMSQFAAALRSVGFEPEERLDTSVTLNPSLLRDYRVVILASNNRRFSANEAGALAQWVRAGGGLVAWSDSAFGGDWREVGVGNPVGKRSNNDLTQQFGLEFLRDNGAGVFTIREYVEDHYLNKFNKNGGLVFRGEGVSLIRASGSARILARLQTGGTRGELRLHPDDGPLTERDGALVVAEVGAGRVLGTFDRNGFWNGGEGTDISEVDNREHAQRIMLWAAGLDD